jgi:hypothetical protein
MKPKKVLFHGPFNTADDIIVHAKGELKKQATPKNANRPR